MGRALRDERGISLVELLVASVVLLGGMLGIVGVLQQGLGVTNLTNQRVAATNLLREITEAARGAVYTDLTTNRIAGAIQTRNRDLDSTSASAWEIRKGRTTYTVAAAVCVYDDPADSIAADAPDGRCSDNPGGATGDQNGDDFRRVTVNLSWSNRGTTKTVRQATLINNPSGGLGPRILDLSGPATAITDPSTTAAAFAVATTRAAAVRWNADDGISAGTAAGATTPLATSWTITWNLKAPGAADAVLDGTYSVSAQAFNDRGIAGDAKVETVTLNRSVPRAPTGFLGGHNTRTADAWVDFDWTLNSERDIIGYRVYWAGGDKVANTSDDRVVCPSSGTGHLPNAATTCADVAPQDGDTRYYVVALDSSPEGVQREGAPTTLDVTAPGARPSPPQTLSVSGTASPVLTWTAPTSGTVAFYRVYRDGTSRAHRFISTTALTATDQNDGQVRDYYVSAVDASYNESDLVGPVSWSPAR